METLALLQVDIVQKQVSCCFMERILGQMSPPLMDG